MLVAETAAAVAAKAAPGGVEARITAALAAEAEVSRASVHRDWWALRRLIHVPKVGWITLKEAIKTKAISFYVGTTKFKLGECPFEETR